MRAIRVVALVLFGASLAANLFFLNARRARPASDDDTSSEEAATSPGRGSGAAGASPTARQMRCAEAIATVELQVAREEGSLRPYLPPHLLFERGVPNPAAQRLLLPIFAGLFGGGSPPTLECKEAACKLMLIESAAAGDEDWDQTFSGTPELVEWTREASLAQTIPVADPAGKPPRVERTVYFKLNGPRAIALAGER